MKKIFYWIAFVFVISGFPCAIKAQSFDSILNKYSSYQKERIYLHNDKAVYLSGETVWFKAYIKEGEMPASASKTLYIDWIDDKGTLLYHTIAPVQSGGVSNGQFVIPEQYKSSVVHIRAYTQWMLNFDSAFIYNKAVKVVQQSGISLSSVPSVTPALHFYPEGGEMIMGLRNKIAFKTTDQWGRPAVIKGLVFKNDEVIDSLKSLHDGMGFFYIIPSENAKYTAKWTDESGKEYTTKLPAAKAEGVSLQVSFTSGKRTFSIECSPGVPEQQKRLHLMGTMYEATVLKADIDLSSKSLYSGFLPTQTLSSGVLTLTVFDEQWQPVAERVLHVNNNDYSFPVELTVTKKQLSKRGLNEIQINVPDSLEANLSVSITNGNVETDNNNTIVSHFLLSSELRGTIYNPSYYFEENSEKRKQQLDLVMLTNGWRRFNWRDMAAGKMPSILYPKEMTYRSLSGKIVDANNSQLAKGGTLMMVVKEKNAAGQTVLAAIENDGSFKSQHIFFDSAKVYYQLPKTITKGSVSFMTEGSPSFDYTKIKLPVINPDTTGNYARLQLLEQLTTLGAGEKMLRNVTVTARIKTKFDLLDEKFSRGLFASDDARRFAIMDDPMLNTYFNIFNYLQGKVAGLQIIGNPSFGYEVSWRGGEPLYYIDEVPVSAKQVDELATQNIAYIKVFRPIFMAYKGEYGAIAIYTRRGDDYKPKEEVLSLPNQNIVGYSPIREFSSPDYATAIESNQADLRTTLLWKPQIVTGAGSNKTKISFYTSDVESKSYRVIIEGMSKDGLLYHFKKNIE